MSITVQSAEEYRSQWKHNESHSVSYRDSYPVASIGTPSSSKTTTAAVLLSRLPKRVLSSEPWLTGVREAVHFTREQGWTLVSSCDLLGWDYVSWYGSKVGIPLIVILPAQSTSLMESTVNRLTIQLNLDVDKTMFTMPVVDRKLKKQERYFIRDKMLFDHASVHIPVAIRPDGRWDGMLRESGNCNNEYQVKYPRPKPPEWRKLLSQLSISHNPEWDGMLFHWTRGHYAPWTGETIADYFDALTTSSHGNPRDGFATLEHIIRSGVLRGQDRMIRGQKPMISFTTVNPAQLNSYVRFRSTFGRWTFEPYGIAVPVKLLNEHKARRVIYGDDELYDSMLDEDKPYFQIAKGKTTDWSGEHEWRLFGDIDLYSIKPHIRLITLREREAIQLQNKTEFDTVSIENMR